MVRHYSLLPPVVRALLIVNVGMFMLQVASGGQLIYALALWPLESPGSTLFM